MLKTIFLSVALFACADNEQTRSEACQEQAEVWCEQVGHPNAACETGYYYRCTPAGTDRDAPANQHVHTACLEKIVSDVDEQHTATPDYCLRFWAHL